MKRFAYATLAGVALIGFGCGSDKSITTELKLVSKALQVSRSADRAATNATTEVTIESLKIPIFSVSLGHTEELVGGEGKANAVYACSGTTAAACMVELVGDALTNLFKSGTGNNVYEVPANTYKSVMVATCTNDGATTYAVEVKAKATLGGTEYYTKTGSTELTTVAGDYGATTITFNGCQNYTVLNNPITIGTEAATVSLFVDLRNVAAAVRNGTAVTYGTCTKDAATASAPVLCMDYPNVAGNLGTTEPKIERYRLAMPSAGTAAPIVGLYFDATTGAPLGGYTRTLLDNTYTTVTNLPATLKRTQLSGTTLSLTDYIGGAGGNTDTIAGDGNFTVAAFPRPDVGATSAATDFKNKSGAVSGQFTATRLD